MIKDRTGSTVCDRLSAPALGSSAAATVGPCGPPHAPVKLESDCAYDASSVDCRSQTPQSVLAAASCHGGPPGETMRSSSVTDFVANLDKACGLDSKIKLESGSFDPLRQPPPPLTPASDSGKSSLTESCSTEFGAGGGVAVKREECALAGGMSGFGGGVRGMVSSDFGLADTHLMSGIGPAGSPVMLGGPPVGMGGAGDSPGPPHQAGGVGLNSPTGVASTQPLPPSGGAINKQPLTADAQYMQQQSHIFVFSTQLANRAFEAVVQSQFPTIIAYHCAQPGTKKYLDKHPLKMSQFSRGAGANSLWLNNNGKRTLPTPARSASAHSQSGGGPETALVADPSLGPSAPRVPRHGMCSASFSTAQSAAAARVASSSVGSVTTSSHGATPSSGPHSCPPALTPSADGGAELLAGDRPLTSVQRLSDEHLTPEQRQHRASQLAALQRIGRMLLPDQSPANSTGAINNNVNGAPCSAPTMIGPDGMPMDPRMMAPGVGMAPGGPMDPRMMGPNGNMGPGMMDPRMNGPINPNGPMDTRMIGPGGVMDNRFLGPGGPMDPRMMGPNGPMDPRMMGPGGPMDPRMMCPNGSMEPRMVGPGGPGDPRMMCPTGPMDPRMMGPGGPVDPRMMGPVGMQPRMMGPMCMMPGNGPPNSMAAQMEWQRLQSEFYDERRKRGAVGAGQPPRMMSSGRMQGPPPPYPQSHSRTPGAVSSPNANVPSPNTTSLPKTSPRLLSPAMYPRLPTPGPSPHPVPSPSPRHISNPGTPVSVPASPAAPASAPPAPGRVPAPDFTPPQSQPPSGAVPGSLSPATSGGAGTCVSSSASHMAAAAAANTGVDMFGQRAVMSHNNNNSGLYGGPQLSKEMAGSGANLMPVPSPQQIQYVNNFDGQELTIHKQPNTGLRDNELPGSAHFDALQGAADVSTSTCSSMMMGRTGPSTPSGPPLTPSGVSGADRFPVPSPQQMVPGAMEPIRQLSPRYPVSMAPSDGGAAGRFPAPGAVMRMPCGAGGHMMMQRAALAPDPADLPLSHVPLNPQQSPLSGVDRGFDPISSMVQMSQQLTSGPNNSANGAGGSSPAGFMSGGALEPSPASAASPRMMSPCPGSPKSMMGPGPPQGQHQFGPGAPRMMAPAMTRPNGGVASFGPAGANVQVKPSAPNTIQYLPTRPQTSNAGARGPPSLEFLQRFTAPSTMAGPLPGTQPTAVTACSGEMMQGSSPAMAPGMTSCQMTGPGAPLGIPMSGAGPMNPSGPMTMSGPNGPMMVAPGPGNMMGPDPRHPGPHMNRPMNVVMGPNGPMVGGHVQPGGYGPPMQMGPGGPGGGMMMPGGPMQMQMGPRGPMMRQNSNPGMPMGMGDSMYGGGGQVIMPGGPGAGTMFAPKGGHMPMMAGSPDGAQPLPPSMGQPGMVKQGQYGAGPGPSPGAWYH